MSTAPMTAVRNQQGFTLLESLVAMAILAMVITYFLSARTSALLNAAETRNWRIAREIAEQRMSELRAGARELPPQSGVEMQAEGYQDFKYRIVIGEAAVADAEGEMAAMEAEFAPDGAVGGDRLSWQRERDRLRRAQSSGLSMLEYEDQLRDEEFEEVIPSEDDLEEVAVFVTFPNIRPSEEIGADFHTFVLKARISTMAIEGLTPERAEVLAEMRGGGSSDEVDSGGGLPEGDR